MDNARVSENLVSQISYYIPAIALSVIFDVILVTLISAIASFITGALYSISAADGLALDKRHLFAFFGMGFVFSYAGLTMAYPFLLAFILPWITFLRIKNISNVLAWVGVPVCAAVGYTANFYSVKEGFNGNFGFIVGAFACTSIIASSLLWFARQYNPVFRCTSSKVVIDNQHNNEIESKD